MNKAEKNRLKLYYIERKYQKLLDQVKKNSNFKEDKKPNDNKGKVSLGDIIPMKLEN